jgi:tetratricopeptide (TPR) repeat protein/predicted Ser/Thr protein kinase
MIGTTVSHYRILEKIGAGGMGEIYLAEDTKLRRKVSLKFLAEELTRDEERKQRFIQEARAAASVEHPHIAAIYDIDEADGRTFIAMEYVRGQSLREVIEAEKLNLRRSLELGFQIADGLAKAHERGVVHRDIKPDNILVSEDGYAKIIDFGLAKLLEPYVPGAEAAEETETKLKTKEGLVMGTISYMSPEQARGESIDARTDIFSFGVVLYEMLSGSSPFRKKSLAESMSAILNETPPALTSSAQLQPEIRRVLRKALAKDLSERYQSMKDLAIDLKELREDVLSTSREAVAVPAASKFPWPWVAVAAVALLGIVLGWALFGRDTAPPGIGETGRPAVAVMYFESLSGDEEVRWLSKGLPNMLITDLAQTPGLDVVSSERIQKILRQIGQEDLESIDKGLVDEIARKAGAGAVVVGSIFKSGDDVRIDVQVQDVSSGRILSADRVQGQDVFPLVDELTGRIRSSLQVGDSAADRPLAEVTTPSLEAFQLYSEGLEARRNVRYTDARKLFEQALQVDSSFAMAHYELSTMALSMGETTLAEEHREKVLENIDRLPERQKLLVQARYANRFEGNTQKAVELLQTLVEQYPDEADGYSELIRIEQNVDKNLVTLERGVAAAPQSGSLRNDYGYALLYRGRYAEGLRQLEKYAELSPDEPNPQDSLAEAYLYTGQAETALEKYGAVLEIDPSFGPSYSGRAWAFAVLGRYDESLEEWANIQNVENPFAPTDILFLEAFTLSRVGRYVEAKATITRSRELLARDPDPATQAHLDLLSAQLQLDSGNYSDAIESTERARGVVPRVSMSLNRDVLTHSVNFLEGIAKARQGEREAAQDLLEVLDEIYDPEVDWQDWMYHSLRGEIALASAELDAAETAFSEGEPAFKMVFSNGFPMTSTIANHTPSRDGLARVRKAQGDLAGAIRIYRGLLTPDMSSKWTAMLEPRYVLELARLLDESGDKESARAEYRRFLDLWKDADEGLPELKEARAYVGQ